MRFGFYVNPVARLRTESAAAAPEPSVVAALAESAGAQVILAGWVPGKGLLTERDLRLMREMVRGDLLLVVPAAAGLADGVARLGANGVVLVDAEWDGVTKASPVALEGDPAELASAVAAFTTAGLSVAALVNPEPTAAKVAAKCRLGAVAFNCREYAQAKTDPEAQEALDRIGEAALAADKFGLVAGVANGIDYRNVSLLASIRHLEEFYCGSAIVQRALLVGLDRAVAEMGAAVFRFRGG